MPIARGASFFLPAPYREAHATTTKRGNVPLFPLQMGLFYSEEHNPILPMKWGNVDPLIWYYVMEIKQKNMQRT